MGYVKQNGPCYTLHCTLVIIPLEMEKNKDARWHPDDCWGSGVYVQLDISEWMTERENERKGCEGGCCLGLGEKGEVSWGLRWVWQSKIERGHFLHVILWGRGCVGINEEPMCKQRQEEIDHTNNSSSAQLA